MTDYKTLLSEIHIIKQSIIALGRNSIVLGKWLPKKTVMKFFDYGETQLRTLERENSIEVSKIGNRKFYSLDSILELLNNNKN